MIEKTLEKNSIHHIRKISTITPCWLDAGTALLLYRDGNIRQDEDIDIGVFSEDVKKLLDNISMLNISYVKVAGKNNIIRGLKCIRGGAKPINVDINIFYATKNYRVLFGRAWYVWIPKIILEDFSCIKWGSQYFFVPTQIKQFLYHRYGNNWETCVDREKWLYSVPRINTKDHERPCMRFNTEVEELMHNMGVVLEKA